MPRPYKQRPQELRSLHGLSQIGSRVSFHLIDRDIVVSTVEGVQGLNGTLAHLLELLMVV